jgi:hypothetical protein
LSLPVTTTFAPCSENRFAIALPFPLVEPVMTATLSSSSFIPSHPYIDLTARRINNSDYLWSLSWFPEVNNEQILD